MIQRAIRTLVTRMRSGNPTKISRAYQAGDR